VVFKEFGLILKFTPRLQSGQKIHLIIYAEMSDLDMGSLVDGFPMISKKKLSTQINARLDEMMALGGVVKAEQSTFSDEMPGLGSVPILGRLFRSEDFKRHKSEAYVFVTARKMEKAWLPKPDL
jgi:pilus assembly protein CpaC